MTIAISFFNPNFSLDKLKAKQKSLAVILFFLWKVQKTERNYWKILIFGV
jgi:hypothetical protein